MILQIAIKLDFPLEAAEYLEHAYTKLTENPTVVSLFQDAERQLFDGTEKSFTEALAKVYPMTEFSPHTVDMVLLLSCINPLLQRYRERGLSEAVCLDTMKDLSYKLAECKAVYGTCGTFVAFWYPRFFRCELFALGRLQYERFPFPYPSYKSLVQQGDTVYKCHIPSSGPLTEASVLDSFRKAYRFFEKELKNGIMPVYCSSWMLYPPHGEEVFSPHSNLRRFYDLFDVIDAVPDPQNTDFWRIFHTDFHPDILPTVPESTSLQRAFKRYLLNGNTMGSGKAILLFDGNRILPKENP